MRHNQLSTRAIGSNGKFFALSGVVYFHMSVKNEFHDFISQNAFLFVGSNCGNDVRQRNRSCCTGSKTCHKHLEVSISLESTIIEAEVRPVVDALKIKGSCGGLVVRASALRGGGHGFPLWCSRL